MPVLELTCLDNTADSFFPPTSQALEEPNGLLAFGGSLSPERLTSAYRQGIFPWYTEKEPILWWTPSPRCILEPGNVYISRRTRRRLRQDQYRITADTAFSEVITACAMPGRGRESTWITPEMISAYLALHDLGIAHSLEVWTDDDLVGGIYGLSLGHMFFGESMFSRKPDTSKIALIYLCEQLREWNFGPIDCQVGNEHLYRMGATDVDRQQFEEKLETFTARARTDGSWKERFDPKRTGSFRPDSVRTKR